MRDETEDGRPDPDELLKSIQKTEEKDQRGKLKIFFGACAGVGKTYTMLSEARAQKKAGVDVVVGVVETHDREETVEQLEGLEILPRKTVSGRSTLHEFDIEAALSRHPQLIIVDELAHSNLRGSRHAKRWQDIEELLDAGIDVYTALNVQHLESLNDVVTGITGITVRETVPDKIFDDASEVKLVDIPAKELLRRLEAGKIYLPNIAARAARSFFREGNIIALRELALRRTADRVDEQMRAYRTESAIDTVWEAQDRFLVAVGLSPDSARVVRETARIANRMKAEWIAVHVTGSKPASEADRKQVFETLKLAEELGAETTELSGGDVVAVLAQYARRRNVTKVVLGARPARWPLFLGKADRLLAKYPDLDVMQIALEEKKTRARSRWISGDDARAPASSYAIAAGAAVVSLVLSAALLSFFSLENVVILVLLVAVATAGTLGTKPAILATVLAVLGFDFFYVPPVNHFTVNDFQYFFTLALVIAAVLYVGNLSGRLRREADAACTRDFRSSSVAELARELSTVMTAEQVNTVLQRHLAPILQADLTLAMPEPDGQVTFLSGTDDSEIEVAQWCYDHSHEAGLGTQTLSSAKSRMVPIASRNQCWCVLAVRPTGILDFNNPDTKRLLDACCSQIGQTFERIRYSEIANDAMVRGESERMRVALLGAISKDITLPVSAILKMTGKLVPEFRGTEWANPISSIRGQAALLLRFTENLSEMTKLQSSRDELNLEETDIATLVTQTAGQFWQIDAGKTITTDVEENLPHVMLDRALIVRSLENLIDNAEKYTPKGTPVEVTAVRSGEGIEIVVRDHGEGMSDEAKSAASGVSGDREKNAGFGLALVRMIAKAHGGKLSAENMPDGGAAVKLWLPADKQN